MLALDPMSRVFGFVVLEGPTRLLDWGVRQTRTEKEAVTLRKVRGLVSLYRPDVLVLEDCAHPSSRRHPRIRSLIELVAALTTELLIEVQPVPIALVHATFERDGVRTKHGIATALAMRFPALAPRLPPERKVWMTEDDRFAIFDAAALAIAFFEGGPKSRR